MKRLTWGIVLVLFVARHDFWYWDDRSFVFGFLPVGLFYHCVLSILAALTWALMVRHGWPDWIEEWAASGDQTGDGRKS